jgi:GntR family transcriptional regulator
MRDTAALTSHDGQVSTGIDYDSAEPPYRQLAAILRARIEAGEITTRLPGERALQQEFGMAIVTVRKAVRVLRDEGIVRTTPGWGTYVIEPGKPDTKPGHER